MMEKTKNQTKISDKQSTVKACKNNLYCGFKRSFESCNQNFGVICSLKSEYDASDPLRAYVYVLCLSPSEDIRLTVSNYTCTVKL